MTDNVLLHLADEPRFSDIRTEDIKPALQSAMADARAAVAAVKAEPQASWLNTVERLTDRCDGVLVLADLGSGIMSVEMALEMLDPAVAERVRLSAAPFVEGLLGAYGAAGIGKDLQAVAAEADGAAEAKLSQMAAF